MRAVIWIIVGILVVAAVAFVLVTRSQQSAGAKITPADVTKKADYFMKQADGVDADVKRLSAMYHEVTPEQFAYIVNMEYTSGAVGQLDVNSIEQKLGFRDIREELHVSGLETCIDVIDMFH